MNDDHRAVGRRRHDVRERATAVHRDGRKLWIPATLRLDELGDVTVLDQKLSPARKRQPYVVEARVEARRIEVDLDGERLFEAWLESRLPAGEFGTFAFLGFDRLGALEIDGRVERSWMRRLADDHEGRARARFERRFDLADEVDQAVLDARRRHPDDTIELVAPDGPVPVNGWRDGLRILIDNLVANALAQRPGWRVFVTGSHHDRLVIDDEASIERIDRVMEKFGWPMGPAYLGDVVGLDTAVHAGAVMAEAYPDRMQFSNDNPMGVMAGLERFGQKNLKGFYRYEMDKRGKPRKQPDPEADAIVAGLARENREVSDEEIVDRMMIPMINESVRCLEDKIVDTAMEVDLGLIYGLGFPPFRGGALKYADAIGLEEICARAAAHDRLGKLYEPPALLREMADSGKRFYAF